MSVGIEHDESWLSDWGYVNEGGSWDCREECRSYAERIVAQREQWRPPSEADTTDRLVLTRVPLRGGGGYHYGIHRSCDAREYGFEWTEIPGGRSE